MQHTTAVDGFYIFVLGGRKFIESLHSYIGDNHLRILDTRNNTWTVPLTLSYCEEFHLFSLYESLILLAVSFVEGSKRQLFNSVCQLVSPSFFYSRNFDSCVQALA